MRRQVVVELWEVARETLSPTRPGMLRVDADALIGLQQGALRAVELEAEVAARRVERQVLERERRARELLVEQSTAAGLVLGEDEARALLADPPATSEGGLHEPAFLALVGQALLIARLAVSDTSMGER